MSFRIPHHPRLTAAHAALARLLAHAIVVDRFVDYEGDDQGGTHTITGQSVALVDEVEGREPLVIWDLSRADHLRYFEDDKRERLAHMMGCKVEDLNQPQHGPAFFPALEELRIGLLLSGIHEAYEVDPVGVSA